MRNDGARFPDRQSPKKKRTHRPELPVVGQHPYQPYESCSRPTTSPPTLEDTHVRPRENSSNKQSPQESGPLNSYNSDYPNVYRPAIRNPVRIIRTRFDAEQGRMIQISVATASSALPWKRCAKMTVASIFPHFQRLSALPDASGLPSETTCSGRRRSRSGTSRGREKPFPDFRA